MNIRFSGPPRGERILVTVSRHSMVSYCLGDGAVVGMARNRRLPLRLSGQTIVVTVSQQSGERPLPECRPIR
jgi:hypothetical protein